MLRSTLAVIAVIGSVTVVSEASAQSFNCRYAKSPTEVAICNDAELSNADRELSVSHSQVAGSLNHLGRAWLERNQAAWRRKRDACGSDPRCLKERIAARHELLASDAIDNLLPKGSYRR